MIYAYAFLIGGGICALGQVLIDKTKLTPARILVLFVVAGCLLSGIGAYEKLIEFAGAGAMVPLPGFGHLLAKGVKTEVDNHGLFGVLSGGLKASAAGISAAVLFAFMAALVFNPKGK